MPTFKNLESLAKQEIWVARTRYYVVGCDRNETIFRILEIDRTLPGQLHITDSGPYSKQLAEDKMAEFKLVHARTGGLAKIPHLISLLGVLSLPRYYLVLIKDKELVGHICGHKIYGLKETVLIPVCHDAFCPATPDFTEASPRYKDLVESLELSNKTDYYFSHTYDLTKSVQANFQQRFSGTAYNEKFVWNMHMALEFLNAVPNGSMWLTCLVYGFFDQSEFTEGASRTAMTLLARRSRHMAGTRFIKRGIDGTGNVANEVETEVMMECRTTGLISSVVVLRGSIPLYWSQRKETEKDFSFSPAIVVAAEKNENLATTQLHFQNLLQEYGGRVVVLSLIRQREKKPKEQKLGVALDEALRRVNQQFIEAQLPEVAYYAYDFLNNGNRAHEDIKKIMSDDVKAMGVFSVNYKAFQDAKSSPSSSSPASPSCSTPASPRAASGNPFDDVALALADTVDVFADLEVSLTEPPEQPQAKRTDSFLSVTPDKWGDAKLQRGIARINCVDCLDRTNVAQFCVARLALKQQLKVVGVDETSAQQYYEALARMFTLHGDRIALQYAGSAAMHKDRIANTYANSEDDAEEPEEDAEDGKEDPLPLPDVVEAQVQVKQSALVLGMASAKTLGYGILKSASGVAKNAFSATKRVVKNNFMDSEKQHAINVFLGVYIPEFNFPIVSPVSPSSSCAVACPASSSSSSAFLPSSSSSSSSDPTAELSFTAAPSSFTFELQTSTSTSVSTAARAVSPTAAPTLTTATAATPVMTTITATKDTLLTSPLPIVLSTTITATITTTTTDLSSSDLSTLASLITTMETSTPLTSSAPSTPTPPTTTTTTTATMSTAILGGVSPVTVVHVEPATEAATAEALSPTTTELLTAEAEANSRKPHVWELDEGAMPHDSRKKFPVQVLPYPDSLSVPSQIDVGTLRRKVSEFDMFMTEAEVKSRDVNVAQELRQRNPNILFLISTSKPTNVVVVEANVSAAGRLMNEQPVDVYWLKQRVSREGVTSMEKEKLSIIENKFLFGVKSQLVVIPPGQPGAGQQKLKCWLTILPARPFLIKPQEGKGFAAHMMVRGMLCEMIQVFMATAERSIGPPRVEHIFLSGKDGTGMAVEERVPTSMIGRKGR